MRLSSCFFFFLVFMTFIFICFFLFVVVISIHTIAAIVEHSNYIDQQRQPGTYIFIHHKILSKFSQIYTFTLSPPRFKFMTSGFLKTILTSACKKVLKNLQILSDLELTSSKQRELLANFEIFVADPTVVVRERTYTLKRLYFFLYR